MSVIFEICVYFLFRTVPAGRSGLSRFLSSPDSHIERSPVERVPKPQLVKNRSRQLFRASARSHGCSQGDNKTAKNF